MKRLIFIFGLLLLCSLTSYSQKGDYYISHFAPTSDIDKSANFDLVQRPDGLIALANREGILLFDGKNWELNPSIGTPLTLSAGTDGIFAGGGFGLGFQPYGSEVFRKLHADSVASNIFQIEIINENIIAIEDKKVHIFTADKEHISSIVFQEGYLRKIIPIGNKILLSSSTGNYWLRDNQLVYADDIPETTIVFSINTDENIHYAGTYDGGLYEITGTSWEEVSFDKNEYSEALEGVRFTDATYAGGKIAITTFSSGILIINAVEKKVDRVVNHNTGLPDDEIFFISADKDGAFWVGHQNGVSRIAPYLPLEAFNNFPGLEGNLTTILEHQGSLYVGTNEGLFLLEEVKNYEEIVRYVKNFKKNEHPTEQHVVQEGGKKRNLLSFLKRKKQEPAVEEQKHLEPVITLEKQVSRELKSIKYAYKKINGIDGKIIQLIPSQEGILASSLAGLFQINGKNAKSLSSEPMRLIWLNRDEDFLIANTYNGELLSFRAHQPGKWGEEFYFQGYQDFLFDIYEDKHQRVWFSSPNEFYFITYDQFEVYHGGDFSYKNPYLNAVYISENEDGISFLSTKETWRFDEKQKQVVHTTIKDNIHSFIKGADGLWALTSQWQPLHRSGGSRWLKAFKDITYITNGEKGNIYVITSSNNLYKIPSEDKSPLEETHHQILLKSITGNGEELKHQQFYRFSQQQKEFAFEFIYPEYTGLMNVEYKYRIVGLNDDWTEWSAANNKVQFNYPPEGNYQLEVKTRTVLGEEISTAPIFFRVVPPYWRQPWFYAFEFTVFGMLLLITIHLNRNSGRYRFLNKLLAFLTLILIIEFIQATAESNLETDVSPVAGFFVQVAIAFIVLPVEGFLRKLIIQNKKLKLPLFLRFYR